MSLPAQNRPWTDQKVYWVTGKVLNDLHERGVVENMLLLDSGLSDVFLIERVPGKPAILKLAADVTIADCEDA